MNDWDSLAIINPMPTKDVYIRPVESHSVTKDKCICPVIQVDLNKWTLVVRNGCRLLGVFGSGRQEVKLLRWLWCWHFQPWYQHSYSPHCPPYIFFGADENIFLLCAMRTNSHDLNIFIKYCATLQGENRYWSFLGLQYYGA